MASLAQLEQALINADRAGRTEDARILAQELQRAMGTGAQSTTARDIAAEEERLAGLMSGLQRSSDEESGFIENVLSGFGAGAVGTGEMASLGAAALLEEEDELAAREKIKAVAKSLRPEGGDKDLPPPLLYPLLLPQVLALLVQVLLVSVLVLVKLVSVHVPQVLPKKNAQRLHAEARQSDHSKYYR